MAEDAAPQQVSLDLLDVAALADSVATSAMFKSCKVRERAAH